MLVVVCKRMQQLPTMLGPEVYRGKDTSLKTLETNPKTLEELFKSIQHWCATLWFDDHGTKEMLGVVRSKGLTCTYSPVIEKRISPLVMTKYCGI